MAGSAPSAFIFLMTALIVSASVSIILVDSWKGIANTYADNRDKAALDAKTEFSFAGNPMQVGYTPGTDTMIFYLQNTGQVILEDTIGGVFVDGVRPGTSATSSVVGSGDWAPGELMVLTLRDTSWTYTDTSTEFEVTLLLVSNSEPSKGVRGTHSLTLTVRLEV